MVLGEKDQIENHALRIYLKPAMSLMWFGYLLMFLAGIISIINQQFLGKFSIKIVKNKITKIHFLASLKRVQKLWRGG